jgi:hypothetical protein
VVASAVIGAIIGDNISYLIGREIGFRVLARFGSHVGLDDRRLMLGRYLFGRHGGKVVFFGRFVAILRTFAAPLAGVNRMPCPSFLLYNALGGIAWSSFYGFGTYALGDIVTHVARPLGITFGVVAAAAHRRSGGLPEAQRGTADGRSGTRHGGCGRKRDKRAGGSRAPALSNLGRRLDCSLPGIGNDWTECCPLGEPVHVHAESADRFDRIDDAPTSKWPNMRS